MVFGAYAHSEACFGPICFEEVEQPQCTITTVITAVEIKNGLKCFGERGAINSLYHQQAG